MTALLLFLALLVALGGFPLAGLAQQTRPITLRADRDAALAKAAALRQQPLEVVLQEEVDRTVDRLAQDTLIHQLEVLRTHFLALTPAQRETFIERLSARP